MGACGAGVAAATRSGATPGVVGLIQVNFIVPETVDAGVQPVVITVDGAPSIAANLTVTEE